MTTIYIPQRIETAEQANALPMGTVATSGQHESFGPFAAIRTGDVPDWYMTTAPDTWADNAEVIGWTALVPIEAEEETRPDTSAIRPWGETTPDPLPEQTRYVTRWENA